MIAGVEYGNAAAQIEITAAAIKTGIIEIWLDDLATGKLVASISLAATGSQNNWQAVKKGLKNVTGRHDVFIKFPKGSNHELFVKSIRFLSK
jgi:hypothetical protein